MWCGTENYGWHRWSIWRSCYIQIYHGRKRGKKQRVERLSRRSLLIRGVPVKSVGHKEDVGSRWDEGMARFHNLKAQETECTHQFSWKNKEGGTEVRQQSELQQQRQESYSLFQTSSDSRLSWELTTVFSVLVKADIDTFNLQMFFSILQESSKTRGRTEEEFHLMTTKLTRTV